MVLREARQEAADPAYCLFEHGTRATYAKGCNGPMCRKGNRDYIRLYKLATRGPARPRVTRSIDYDPFLETYTQYCKAMLQRAIEAGAQPPRRRDSGTRVTRTERPVPVSTIRSLHKDRPALG